MTPEREATIKSVLSKRQPDLAVVTENVKDQHNIFAIMRTCDAVGIQDVYAVNTQFKRHFKLGKSSSSSAEKWVTLHEFDSVEECMAVVKKKYEKVLASYLSDDASSLYDLDLTQSSAIVLGNETFGVSEEMLKHCDGSFLIPQSGMIKSLNVSVACAVTLYEAKRQRIQKDMYSGEQRISDGDYKSLSRKWGVYDIK